MTPGQTLPNTGLSFPCRAVVDSALGTWAQLLGHVHPCRLDTVVLSEVSQTEEQTLYDIPYMWNLKRYDAKKLFYKTETDTHT